MTQLPLLPAEAPGEAVETWDGRRGTVDRVDNGVTVWVGFLAPETRICPLLPWEIKGKGWGNGAERNQGTRNRSRP